jgi:sulfane dehydrogenase subunit SoxC
VFVSPAPDRTLRRASDEIWGWAWSANKVRSVDVSTDGGSTWHEAVLEARSERSWQRFSYVWSDRKSGAHELMCRATDQDGNTQPHDRARNAIYGITVTST